ncbi:MAG: GAF domain-containing protein [Alphaproteobacteria bacterium]|nr:GAF domain-containing protein [Alphaproteobacteria bacterium]
MTETKAAPAKPADGLAGDEIKRLQQAEMLLALSRRVAAIDSLDEIIATVMEMTAWEVGAERATLFLNDSQTGELYSRFAQGNFRREIRFLNNQGIAGHVFQTGESLTVDDPYNDPRFNRQVDQQTGFTTRNIIGVPVRTVKGEIIGVAQCLNKKDGAFREDDLRVLESMTMQATVALQSSQFIEKMKKNREKEMEFLDVVADVTSEIDLGSLLKKVMGEATKMLHAERSTLFLNDEKTNQLWSQVGEGLGATQIRLPNHLGIAGAVFTSGKTVNIPHAYADLRFNPTFDKKTGFFTRSILCVPVVNKQGKVIGVTQVLNKKGGPFTNEDEQRLRAFTAQISIGLENAKLFADVQNMKNYNEAMLQSMSNGVLTMNEDGKIATCNTAGARIFKMPAKDIVGKAAKDFFAGDNAWLIEKIQKVEETETPETAMDAELACGGEKSSVNINVQPLTSAEGKKLGSMVMIEDISSEKRMKSTMARYMDPGLADQLLASGAEALGGRSVNATMLFSDVRGFTTLSENLGPQGIVSVLNEYFTLMVDCISREGGMLDKFIGDAIMAEFGLPVPHDDDEDRAVRAAIAMMRDMNTWNADRAAKGMLTIDMGIGLNTGEVVSGNIGSPKRMDYTVIGDGVNLAARLESACKQYAAHILASENTIKKLKGTYHTREVDLVVVKGKTKPVGVHEILDYHTDQSFPNVMDCINQFRAGIQHYRAGDWDRAIGGFREALKANPGDELSNIYIERCEHLKAEPPEKWDGVYVMKSK